MEVWADYWARVAGGYTQGGFEDEYGGGAPPIITTNSITGKVLNEVGAEHERLPECYIAIHDAIVTQVRKVAPRVKFVGMASDASGPLNYPEYLFPRSQASRGGHHTGCDFLSLVRYTECG